jgi:uncharacterized HhH-GPD family protein
MINWDKKVIIAKKLIEFGNELSEEEAVVKEHQTDLRGNKLEEDECNPVKNPLKFLFGVIFDQGIAWERAWKAPTELEKRLKHSDITKIAKMKKDELEDILRQQPALHRFPRKLADWLIEACKLLFSRYDGEAKNIWSGAPTAKDLENRFRGFKGIGQKKGSMAVNILVRDYDVPISGSKSGIDISCDIHVRRVFLRTELVERDSKDDMIEIARKLNPQYPGELDKPAWKIGSEWCHPQNPECNKCVLEKICQKLLDVKITSM